MQSDFIEKGFFEVILSTMRQENALALRVSLATGLRIGDVLALAPSALTDDNTVETVCQKTGKVFRGGLPAAIAERLRRNAGKKWLFPSPKDWKKHRTRQAVWNDLRKARQKCGVTENITPHSARKIFAVEVFKRDGLAEVQERLQHDNVTTSMIYALSNHISAEKEKAAHASRAQAPPALAADGSEAARRCRVFAEKLLKNEQVFVAIMEAAKAAFSEEA